MFLAYLAGFVLCITVMFLQVEIYSYTIWMIRKAFLTKAKREDEVSATHIKATCKRQIVYNQMDELMRCTKIVGDESSTNDTYSDNSLLQPHSNFIRAVKRTFSCTTLPSMDLDEENTDVNRMLRIPHVGRLLGNCMRALDGNHGHSNTPIEQC